MKRLGKMTPLGALIKAAFIVVLCLSAFAFYSVKGGQSKETGESTFESIEETDEPPLAPVSEQTSELRSSLEVHFIDVGQGDATLIICDDEAMLIDAGDNDSGTLVQKYLQDNDVKELKYVVATHPDADHIGGMDVIITKFDCGMIFMPDVEKDTDAYRDLLDAMNNRKYEKTLPVVGNRYRLGDAEFQMISPALTYAETNNNSIVIRLVHGENSFLFTGDAEVQAQQEMTYGGYPLQSDVMKIPHHGGTSGYQKWFYEEVKPTYAVISCEKGNSYGHPHKEVLEALKELEISVFRTDEQGSIVAASNGTDISWNCTSSTTWKAGEKEEVNNNTPVEPVSSDKYAVNGKSGKIHIVGKCRATQNESKNVMKNPVYFKTYEEAEAQSVAIDGGLEKRRCGNCW